MASNSTADIYRFPPKFTFGSQFDDNVRHVLANVAFFQSMANTAVVAISTTLLVLFFDSLAAFTFAKFRFPGRQAAVRAAAGDDAAARAVGRRTAVPDDGDPRLGRFAEGADHSGGGERLRHLLDAAVLPELDPRRTGRGRDAGRLRLPRHVLARRTALGAAGAGVPRHLHVRRVLERLHVAADRAHQSRPPHPAGGAVHSSTGRTASTTAW